MKKLNDNFLVWIMNSYILKDLVKIKNGKDHKSQVSGSIPVYGSGGLMLHVDRPLYEKESVLLPRKGTLDNIQYVNHPFWTVDTIYYTEINNEKVVPLFLYHYLKQLDLSKLNTGTGVPSMTFDSYYDVPVKLPSLNIQHKLATVLSALEDEIELNRKINAELDQMAHTLYDYWFVQFDFPNSEGKPYKSSGGQMTYSDQLKREIPAGWEVQDMYANDLFEIIKPKINKFAGTKQYIATADVNGLAMTDGMPITYEGRESRANMQPREYTIWFAKMKESVKHIFVGDYSEDLMGDAIFSTGFMGMQTSKEAFEYLTLTIHRPYFELVKDANSNGATMVAIGNNDMKNIKLIVPSDDVLHKIHRTARPILAKIDRNRQQSKKLAHLRDWLLPMLMNGQLSI